MLCSRCAIPGRVYKQINTSGSIVVVERCPKCRTNTNPRQAFLPKSEYDIDKLEVFEDYSKDAHPCEYKDCENKGSEYHHFAPQHLFKDADNWPTGWLCSYHHDLWHKTTGTGVYYGSRKRKIDRLMARIKELEEERTRV